MYGTVVYSTVAGAYNCSMYRVYRQRSCQNLSNAAVRAPDGYCTACTVYDCTPSSPSERDTPADNPSILRNREILNVHHGVGVMELDTSPQWLLASVLAFSSSTDNFAVGLSVALAGSTLPPRVNLIISVCNALGALLSTAVGVLLGKAAPTLGSAAAAAVFIYLAWEELTSWRNCERTSPLARSASAGLVWKLALPMTLNNLAGGVASGVIGVAPLVAGTAALLASYVMMAFGFFLGKRLGFIVEQWMDPRVLAAAVFVSVAVAQLIEALSGLSD